MQNSYTEGYYNDAVEFIRGFYSSTIKDNAHLKKGVLTGVSRIAKESIFSGLNNLSVCTVMDDEFSDSFGFTEEETEKILNDFEIKENLQDVKKWYDGYKIGSFDGIYNPWSILNYAKKKELMPYWVNTSSNDLIKIMMIYLKII